MRGLEGEPERVLIVRPSALGDVARTVPALVSIKRAWPDATVDWLVRDTFAEAISGHPDLGEAVPFPRRAFAGFWRRPSVMRKVLAFCGDLRRRRYDAVFDLQGLGRSGAFTWATRAPRRFGPGDARELAWLGYTDRVRLDYGQVHTVDRMLGIVEAAGIEAVRDMRLHPPAEARTWAAAWLAERGIETDADGVAQNCVAVAPTAKWASKRWPIDRYDAVLRELAGMGYEHAIILGGPGEEPATAPLTADADARPTRHDLTGRTGVGQMMALIERTPLLIANDSAALHIAVGLGRRCVGIFGPTDPATVGPYRYDRCVVQPDGADAGRVNYRALRDDDSVIARVGVDRVMATVQRVLDTPPPGDAAAPAR